MPSGCSPDEVLRDPERFEGMNCLSSVPQELLQPLREELEAEFGPRETLTTWYPEDFNIAAQAAYRSISSPVLSLNSGWAVFEQLRDLLHALPVAERTWETPN